MDNYNRKQYKFDKTMPLAVVGYNFDDGIFVGGGIDIKNYNFRDSSFHQLIGKMSFQTGAFAITYKGLISSISQRFNLELNANISAPRSVDNYFGPGNETEKFFDSKRYYSVRYRYAWINPALRNQVNKSLSYSFGAFYQYYQATDTVNRFIAKLYPEVLSKLAFIGHNYTGLNTDLTFDTRNHKALPQRGIFWKTSATGFYSIKDDGKYFVKLQSDLSFYLSFRKDPRFVLAAPVGGTTNIGDYEFYPPYFSREEKPILGGISGNNPIWPGEPPSFL